MAGPHDIGGKNLGPINFTQEEKTSLDKRIDVLQRLVGGGGVRAYRVDELRFKIESLPQEKYRNLRYYERWLFAIYNLLIDKDILTDEEIQKKINSFRSRGN